MVGHRHGIFEEWFTTQQSHLRDRRRWQSVFHGRSAHHGRDRSCLESLSYAVFAKTESHIKKAEQRKHFARPLAWVASLLKLERIYETVDGAQRNRLLSPHWKQEVNQFPRPRARVCEGPSGLDCKHGTQRQRAHRTSIHSARAPHVRTRGPPQDRDRVRRRSRTPSARPTSCGRSGSSLRATCPRSRCPSRSSACAAPSPARR